VMLRGIIVVIYFTFSGLASELWEIVSYLTIWGTMRNLVYSAVLCLDYRGLVYLAGVC
jgi:hypothetical protein